MSSSAKPVFYEFTASGWAQSPKLAIIESDIPKDAIEFKSINLGKGENFEEEYLKISQAATVPALTINGKTYTDTTSIIPQLLAISPHPPQHSPLSNPSTSELIKATHDASIDPNAIFLHARSGEEREEKRGGMVGGFLKGRQETLKRLNKNASPERKEFYENKLKFNTGLYEIYFGEPSEEALNEHYATAHKMWKAIGEFIAGTFTKAVKHNGGPFVAGEQPAEADFHVIAYLARIASCAGAAPGDPSAITLLAKATEQDEFDPAVEAYWKAWIGRESFKTVNVK